jgi:hypothetical protein
MDKPEATDVVTEEVETSFDDIFEETGVEDVEGKGGEETKSLSREQIEKIAGRTFESDEDFLKHYENLKNLVGDQELAKERKAKKAEAEKPKSDTPDVAQELAQLKTDIAKKDFLLDNPSAKEYMDVLEAYADKNGMPLQEAWEKRFSAIAETSQRKVVINKNRINPVQSQQITSLAAEARKGNQAAQDALINDLVWKK